MFKEVLFRQLKEKLRLKVFYLLLSDIDLCYFSVESVNRGIMWYLFNLGVYLAILINRRNKIKSK